MFGIEIFEWTPVSGNQVLGSENRVFNSTTEPNVITHSHATSGIYAISHPKRYGVDYPEAARTGTLTVKAWHTLASAIQDATSGTNSTSLTHRIDSYWEDDKAAAIAAGATDFPCYDGWCDATAEERTPPDCDGDGRKANADGTCGICKDGYTEDSNGDCIDSSGGTDECESGYELDDDGNCIEPESSNMTPIIGGIAVLGVVGYFLMQRK